jgi:hypothetical protein
MEYKEIAGSFTRHHRRSRKDRRVLFLASALEYARLLTVCNESNTLAMQEHCPSVENDRFALRNPVVKSFSAASVCG